MDPKGHWKHKPKQWPGGPPWQHGWSGKRQFLFLRFMSMFGLMALLVVGGMAALAFLITRWFGGDGQTAMLVWLGGCSLSVALPLLAGGLAVRAFRGITTPLADVMTAAETVAGGDLSVRVSERNPGEFGRLGQTFNRMVEELELSDQLRRNLTADVAHELRTPLHIIQGNLEGILDGVYQPTAEHLEATLDETRLLARLVDDLRTLSLAETGQLSLILEPVEVAEILADIATSFSGQAEAAGIDLVISTTELREGQPVRADAARLNQVLGNLVVNALRHTPSGGRVTLRAASRPDEVKITVTDTGEGIAAEDLPHIFDRFWRGDRSQAHSGRAGGGLGLAIARQLVQALGGRIAVDSEVGRGTTFTITLPVSGAPFG